ncbi:MAG TPA: NAD(P)H-dependent oxidoreductase subunit E [Nitriliruptorales bacterium]|nr:NAD(P)H-dependent oxidoreductase subunit E [Nitriliruptorales bacterium]
MPLSEKTRATADRLIARYPQPRSALMPLLYLIQADQGYVTEEGIAFCAEKLKLTKAEVQAAQTFYQMYERDDPGDWLVTVCVNFSCKVRGGQAIYDRWVEHLGGDRDAETGVRIKHLECLGNCDGAPVVQVNYQNYERVTLEQADELLEACRRGEPPPAVSGERPPTFREVSWRLAGADEAERLHAAAVRAAQADLTSYERPPAERVYDAEKDIGGPGTRLGGPVIGDTSGIEPADEHDREPPSEQPPAAERLDEPARVPTSGEEPSDEHSSPDSDGTADGQQAAEHGSAEDESAEDGSDGGESSEDGSDGEESAEDEEEPPGGPLPEVGLSQSGGTAHVRRLDADAGRDSVHRGDAPTDAETDDRAAEGEG